MKLIIQNDSKLDMANALARCLKVIEGGLVSSTSKGPQYCFVSTFNDGSAVYTFKNKNSQRMVVTSK